MSHEIRTPMNAIVGMTHLLARDELKAVQRQRVQRIFAASEHLLGVINDILDLSRIEADKLQLEMVPFRLSALLGRLQALLHDRLQVSGLAYEQDVAGIPEFLCGDVTRIAQVLLNYLGNAVKFTRHGQIRLYGRLLADDEQGLLLHFAVSDSGIGIAPEVQARLFNAFEQGEDSTTRRFGGTGLGLAINRKFAALMGGEVGVESTPGQGSTFWVNLRVQPASEADLPACGAAGAAAGRHAGDLSPAGGRG